jgi:hypothetical protein
MLTEFWTTWRALTGPLVRPSDKVDWMPRCAHSSDNDIREALGTHFSYSRLREGIGPPFPAKPILQSGLVRGPEAWLSLTSDHPY